MTGSEYAYDSSEQAWTDAYIEPCIVSALRGLDGSLSVLDAGCGNGNLTARLAREGFRMVGFDVSHTGIERAREAHPDIRYEVASAYEDLSARFGATFDA